MPTTHDAVAPESCEACASRAEALVDSGEPAQALALAEEAIRRDPRRADGFAARVRARRALGQGAAALADLDAVIERAPNAALAHDARGVLLSEAGRIAEARVAFSVALHLDPRLTRAHFGLAMLGDISPEQLLAMEAVAREPARLDASARLFLLYALARGYDETHDFARAFAAAEAGAWLRRRHWTGDEAFELQRLVDAGPAKPCEISDGDPSQAPIFLFGMPRSGTSLVEQILAGHPDVFALGETEAFAREAARCGDGKSLAAAYLAHWPDEARQARRVVDKSLGSVLEISAIRSAFPRAKLVHVQRDPWDCALSCFFCLFAQDMPFPPDLAGIRRYIAAYRALMGRWRDALSDDVMHEIQYEQLIADPENQVRAVLGFCGLEWNPSCLTFHLQSREVRTASLAQVRRPLYASAVGRARKYEAFLAPLRQTLDGRAEIGEMDT